MTTQLLEAKRQIPAPTEPAIAKAPASGTFPAADAADFRAEDKHAAAAIAGIMVAILSAGLIAYIFIACWVLAWPM